MSRQATRNITATINRLDTAGITLPGDLRNKIDAALHRATALTDWTPPGGGFVTRAAEAIAADRDPCTDETVIASLVAEMLNQREVEVQAAGITFLADLARTNITDIVNALDEVYQKQVVRPLSKAVTTLTELGVTSHETPSEQVLRLGGKAADAWSAVRTTTTLHSTMLGELGALTLALNLTQSEQVFQYADPNGLPLDEVRALGRTPHPWDVLHAGMTLALADPATADARARTAAAQMEADINRRIARQRQAASASLRH